MRLAFCFYWSDWSIVSASSSQTAEYPPALSWHTQTLLAALHSGSFGFPQQLGSVDPGLKIRQIILWCSRLVWEYLLASTVVQFWCREQFFWLCLLWLPSLLNNSELMNGATLWLHQLSFSGRGSAHGWCTSTKRGGEEKGESQADHS